MNEPVGSRLERSERLSPAVKWVFAIVGLLGANAAAMTILISKANDEPSRVVPAYSDNPGSARISKGHNTPLGVRSGIDHNLRYRSAAEAAQRNPAVRWTTEVAIVDGIMTLAAHDDSGAPLVGARVAVTGSYRSRGQRIVGDLAATAPGEYQGHIGGTGWIDLSIAIERDGSRYVRDLAVLAQ